MEVNKYLYGFSKHICLAYIKIFFLTGSFHLFHLNYHTLCKTITFGIIAIRIEIMIFINHASSAKNRICSIFIFYYYHVDPRNGVKTKLDRILILAVPLFPIRFDMSLLCAVYFLIVFITISLLFLHLYPGFAFISLLIFLFITLQI